jgi:hypothetical protein
LTERMDVYIGAVVILMFLAGCFFVFLAARERSEARRRSGFSTDTKTAQRSE